VNKTGTLILTNVCYVAYFRSLFLTGCGGTWSWRFRWNSAWFQQTRAVKWLV